MATPVLALAVSSVGTAAGLRPELHRIGAIIKRQFIYLFCFSSNIIELKHEDRQLSDRTKEVQAQVNEGTNNIREIHREVTSWIEVSNNFNKDTDKILSAVRDFKGGCLARCSLSRKARKAAKAMAKHRLMCNFSNISLPPPPTAAKAIPLGPTHAFDSRNKIEQSIMKALSNNEVNMIGIHGMGGLGKTTMAKRIMNELLNKEVFKETVIAVVSQQVDELKIQLDIGGPLGLKDLQNETAQVSRAQMLNTRLSAGKTRILLVLDDVWEKELTYFCGGLSLIEDLVSLQNVRNRICSLVMRLKNRSLLLDGRNQDYVRIHDVIRDVCIFIAKQERYINVGNDCTWISYIQQQAEGIEALRFPKLRLFFSEDDILKIDNSVFEGMAELNVFSIEKSSCRQLPSIKNLRTLLLYDGNSLETISVVGGLVTLEILICRFCLGIKELPQEIKGLKRLKLLEFTGCKNLQSIGRGIISSLVKLEELKMLQSFDKWDGQMLKELESLTKLTCLKIQIADPAITAQQINFSSEIKRFEISFFEYQFFPKGYDKRMALWWAEGTHLGNWIKELLKKTECLYLVGDGASNINFAKNIPNIQWLILQNCGVLRVLQQNQWMMTMVLLLCYRTWNASTAVVEEQH